MVIIPFCFRINPPTGELLNIYFYYFLSPICSIFSNIHTKKKWWRSTSDVGRYTRHPLGRVFPPLTAAGPIGCSVAGLTRCGPLGHRDPADYSAGHTAHSSLGVGAASAWLAAASPNVVTFQPPMPTAWLTDPRD